MVDFIENNRLEVIKSSRYIGDRQYNTKLGVPITYSVKEETLLVRSPLMLGKIIIVKKYVPKD